MTRIIYSNTHFETNGDCSRFQINFHPDAFSPSTVDDLKSKLRAWGFPVCDPLIPEPMSIIFLVPTSSEL